MATLSIALATYHKDTEVLRTIKSVYDWVDELVIVYGSPQDKLVASIKKYDSKKKIVWHFTDNPPMFHINKQKAVDRCTKDWIFQIDGDEVVTPALKKEILATIKNFTPDSPVGYWIPRLNYFLGRPLRKGGQYPDPTIRLYKNGSGHLRCKSVHEQAEIDGPIGTLTHDLLHYPYPDFREFLFKWSKYGALEGDLKASGFKPSMWTFVQYMIIKPKLWFLKTYFRHKGFMDGFPGFVFSLFSAIRFWTEYIRAYERYSEERSRSRA